MSADNYIAIVKKGKIWTGYYCCASIEYPFNDCYACIASKKFEETTELKALHKVQAIETETYLEYGYNFLGNNWLTTKQKEALCPCEQKRFMTQMEN